jgi:putative lipoic acid-binding regulatory protein
MGDFDPPSPDTDNENVDGNILNAMLNFPCKYDFNVVGLIDSDDDSSETYASLVQSIISENTGDENIQCRIKPRGHKYIKLTITATVESSAMISNVLSQIAELRQTIMRF